MRGACVYTLCCLLTVCVYGESFHATKDFSVSGYTVEFGVIHFEGTFTCRGDWDYGRKACNNHGSGWTIGSVPNSDVNSWACQNKKNDVWTAGYRESGSKSTSVWKWAGTGRRAGVHYSTGSRSANNQYVNWERGEPNSNSFAGFQKDRMVVGEDYSCQWADWYSGGGNTGSSMAPCSVLCERSACTRTGDCNWHGNPGNTYYSNGCNCQCDEGWKGSRCEQRGKCTVALDCNGHAAAVTGDYPHCRCTCQQSYVGSHCNHTQTATSTLSANIATYCY